MNNISFYRKKIFSKNLDYFSYYAFNISCFLKEVKCSAKRVLVMYQ